MKQKTNPWHFFWDTRTFFFIKTSCEITFEQFWSQELKKKLLIIIQPCTGLYLAVDLGRAAFFCADIEKTENTKNNVVDVFEFRIFFRKKGREKTTEKKMIKKGGNRKCYVIFWNLTKYFYFIYSM